MWNEIRYTQNNNSKIELDACIIRPKKFTYFLFLLLHSFQTTLTLFVFIVSDSWLFLSASIVFMFLFLRTLPNIFPECHSIALDLYGVYITQLYKTAFYSWKEILEIKHVKSNKTNYIAIRIQNHPEHYNFFKQGDFSIPSSMNIKPDLIKNLMEKYKAENEKLELEKYNPNVNPNFLFFSANAWGRQKVSDLENMTGITIWQKFKRYRNRKS